jgi:hypothetical protein
MDNGTQDEMQNVMGVAELLAMGVAACQFALCSCQLLRELGIKLPDCFELYSDNRSALMVAHTPVGSRYTKHIDVGLMFLKELCRDRKVFDILFAESAHNHANHGTKSTGWKLFEEVRAVYKGTSKQAPPGAEVFVNSLLEDGFRKGSRRRGSGALHLDTGKALRGVQ